MFRSSRRRRPGTWAGYLLGFAFGGFFDGILLHQILQWHHLLIGVRTGPLRGMRAQIMADGLFHLLMYAIALAGVWALWRSHRAAVAPTGRRLFADALIGFGAWHALDAVLSHWILGIHRIRMDAADPLFWDVAWLLVFGVIPLLTGLALARGGSPGSPPAGSNAAGAALVLLVSAAAAVAALPPNDVRQVAVLVRPGDMGHLLDGVHAARGGILWGNRSGSIWVFSLPQDARPAQLYAYRALYVTRSPAVLGCLAWTRRKSGSADAI